LLDLRRLFGAGHVGREVVEGTARPLYIYAARAGDAGASAS